MTLRDFKEFAKRIIKKNSILIFIAEIVQAILSPKEQFSVWKDYWAYKKNLAFLRKHPFSSDSKTALLILASDMVYEAKIQGMLALGLRMKGWRVVFLLSHLSLWAKRYLKKAYGFSEFIHWEDLALSAKEKKQCFTETQAFLSRPITFQSVKEWIYHKAWIGPQVISSVSRYMMQGAPDVDDPQAQKYIARLLPETIETVHMAERLLDRLQPKLISLIEANYALMGALVDTAISRNVSVIQTVQPARDDAMIFKKLNFVTRRIHPSSVSKESMEKLASLHWTDEHERRLEQEFKNRYGGAWFLQSRNQPGVKQKSREEIVKQLQLDSLMRPEGATKKIAVVFSPVLWDANLFYGEDLFEDFGDWFVQTVRAACENPNVNWIIKMHPANLWKRAREKVHSEFSEVMLIRKEIGDLPDHVKLLYPNTDISTWSLFELTDYGVTVRGTIGMELPCLGKPVFTAGTGRYSGLGFTIDSTSKEEYLEKLAKIQEFPSLSAEETLLAKKHAYAVFLLRPWPMKSFKAVFNYQKKGIHPLDHNLLLKAHSLEEIQKNGDLEKWAAWAADEKSIDYLDFPEKL